MAQETGGLTLKELLTLVLKDFKIVLALAVVGTALGAVVAFTNVASSLISRTYTVSMELAIVAQTNAGTYGYGRTEPGSEDVTAARNSIYTAARVIEGDQVLNAAIKKLGLIGVSSSDLASKISADALKDSQILTVTLRWNDPDEGVEIMNAIAEVTPDVLIDTLKLGNASVIDSPKVLNAGSGMQKNLMMVLVGLLAGVFVGIAIVVLRDMLFPKVVDPLAMRDIFEVKVMGTIPDDPTVSRRHRSHGNDNLSLIHHQYHENFATSAHLISHHLHSVKKQAEDEGMAWSVRRARIIYVTSSVEQEGKSTCVARLAEGLAREGWKTLLIDCDLRNPSLAPLFFNKSDKNSPLDADHSMNAILARGVAAADAVLPIEENLFILPSAIEETRIELDYRTAEVCASFGSDYDVILIDTPPVGQVSDAMALNRIADECLFIVRYNYATYQIIQSNLDVLQDSGAKILGAVVNRIDTRFSELPRYSAKYSSRYGSGRPIMEEDVEAEEPKAKQPDTPELVLDSDEPKHAKKKKPRFGLHAKSRH